MILLTTEAWVQAVKDQVPEDEQNDEKEYEHEETCVPLMFMP